MILHTANPFEGIEECVTENHPLAPHTWYKIGGPARWWVQPRSIEELQTAAQRCAENDIPVYVLGLGANLLVSDQGVNGAVFRFDQEFWRRVKFDKTTVESARSARGWRASSASPASPARSAAASA
jgi:UDP-N-acetylmuramate dehydrogenase